MLFQTSSQIQQVSTKVDGSYKVVVITQELLPEQAAALFALKGKQGWMLFKENEIKIDEVPPEPSKEFKKDKSPSQQLRDVLWVYWDNNTSHKPDFETFYRQWIQKKIEEIKEFLPER